jgi:hypothetical protein
VRLRERPASTSTACGWRPDLENKWLVSPTASNRSHGLGAGTPPHGTASWGQVPAARVLRGTWLRDRHAQARIVADCRAFCAATSSSHVKQSGQISQSASSLTGSQCRNSAEAGSGAPRRHRMHSFTATSDIARSFDDRGGGSNGPSPNVTVRVFRVLSWPKAVSIWAIT